MKFFIHKIKKEGNNKEEKVNKFYFRLFLRQRQLVRKKTNDV